MAKTQQEIHETESIPWKPVEGIQGMYEKVLNLDPDDGSVSRLLKFEPGTRTTELLVHDFIEEIYIIEGRVFDTGQDLELKAGYYGYRHPGMKHGPYYSPDGALQFEIRNYK